MAFMGNNFNRFARDVMRMEVASSDMKLRLRDYLTQEGYMV